MFLKNFNVENKTALVTGSGKGIGKACAIALAEAGANVIILSRTEKDLLIVQNKIKKQGGQGAELIEKVTRKTSDKIKVTKKEVSNGN